jgi:hypothetical protein
MGAEEMSWDRTDCAINNRKSVEDAKTKIKVATDGNFRI